MSHQSKHRTRQRGAAVFIVVLVVTLLSALGLFALRSSSLTNLASGYQRQMTQTHYMTDYGVLLMAAELGGPARQNYADEMKSGAHNDQCEAALSLSNPSCFPVFYQDLEQRVQSFNNSNELLLPASADGTTPGSLGPAQLEGDVRVELADITEAPDMSGMALTGGGSSGGPGYYLITLTATGQVRPTSANPQQCDIVSRGAAGIESSRARLLVGPLTP